MPSADCLAGVCDPATKTCVEQILPGNCYVGATAATETTEATPGECYATGDTNPRNACQHCSPTDDATARVWSFKPGQTGWESESVIDGATGELVPECVDPCDRYCAQVESSCVGDVRQYSDGPVSGAATDDNGFMDCRQFCQRNWLQPDKPDGGAPLASDARGGDAIACRYAAAQGAVKGGSDALLLCPFAGGTGGNLCGSWCENYCHLAALNCSIFPTYDSCLEQCANVSTNPSDGPRTGDNIQCRIYFAGLAALENASANCKEASIGGTSACVNASDIKGDSCFNPLRVDRIPFFAEASTKGARSDYRTPCAPDAPAEEPSLGPGTPDHTWALDAEVGETYTITLTPSFAANLVVLTNTCGALRCGGGSAFAKADENATLTFNPTATGTYYILIDGHETPDVPPAQISGGYTLAVDRGPTCADYCTKVTQVCSEASTRQYGMGALPEGKTGYDECLIYCSKEAKLPSGSTSDSYGNTVGCRLFHTLKAEQVAASIDVCSMSESDRAAKVAEIDALCEAAGKSGGESCGSTCDNFCHVATARCTGANQAFESASQCEKNCNNYADGQPLDTSGNSKWCRLNFLAAAPVAFVAPEGDAPPANAADLATACAAAKDKSSACQGDCISNCAGKQCGQTSCGKSCGSCGSGLSCDTAGQCVPDCTRYCEQALCNCPSSYPNSAACLTQCAEETAKAAGGASTLLECMTWHAAHATDVVDAELTSYRCGKAGSEGWAKCGSWCHTYCDLAMENCAGTPKLYNTIEDCQTACSLIPVDSGSIAVGFPNPQGDTVQCRLGFLFSAKQTPALSCPEAVPAELSTPGSSKVCASK